MTQNRDMCWLKTKISDSALATFFINVTDKITSTIIEEMAYLFPNITSVETSEANIVFEISTDNKLGTEGFIISKTNLGYKIAAQTSKGLLYGMYRLYTSIVTGASINDSLISIPDQSIRMINHWDNISGNIERGYAGNSIFYENDEFRRDFDLIRQYARLLSSVGINAVSINNVNVHKLEARFILEENFDDIKKIYDIFAGYGIKTFLSVNFAAPIALGGLNTADPSDKEVNSFWEKAVNTIYNAMPDFGGFVVKADSEGQPGPFSYNRGHDDGANMFARALKPHGGIVIWRCFVYNHKQDWRDRTIDRARAAYDNFIKLDGKFDDNVILQIKFGPIDFQVREAISPLFGALKKTNQLIEFQITQEYTGQQKAIYYLTPVFKEALDFDTKYSIEKPMVKDILKTYSINPSLSGIAAVNSVGMDQNWTGHKLMQINLFAFGRICWNNNLSSDEIADEWIDLSFKLSEKNKIVLKNILLTSRETYEYYTTPLGIGFMCKPHIHYGPDIDGYEYSLWGTYHFADRNGIGVDRSLPDGTGYTRQYSDQRFEEYNSTETCPDELLLFFHHVPYTHVLHSGKTLIQHIYDTHFEGVERVEQYIEDWSLLENEIDEISFQNVCDRLQKQLQTAIEWRDQINTYFYRRSGIMDEHNRKIYR